MNAARLSCLLLALGFPGAPACPARPQADPPARKDPPKGKLGMGFLLTPTTEGVLPRLTSERDFVDLVLGPGKVPLVKGIKPPVQVACLSMSLQGMEKTVSLLKEEGIPPDRILVGYNPEQREVTPAEELKDLLGSLKRGRELAGRIKARFLVGPGLRFMEAHEDLYPEAARLCDAWVIQSQRLQVKPDSREAVPAQEYRTRVKKIVDLLRQGNPGIVIIVQILSGRGKGDPLFNAEQIAGYALAIEDLVAAVRIYGGSKELILEVLDRIRPPQRP